MSDLSRRFTFTLILTAALSVSAQEDPVAEDGVLPETSEGIAAKPETVTEDTEADPAALELLDQMAEAHQDLETLRGEFTQRTQSEELLEDIETTGTFLCRSPDLFRYDYNASEGTSGSTYFVNGNTAYAYVEEPNQVEVYHLDGEGTNGRGFSQILIGLDGAVEELRETYFISLLPPDPADEEPGEDTRHLRFEPKEGVDPQGFTSIDLWVNASTLLPAQLKMVAESNESLTLRITEMTRNPDIDDSEFDPRENVPADTEFVEQ